MKCGEKVRSAAPTKTMLLPSAMLESSMTENWVSEQRHTGRGSPLTVPSLENSSLGLSLGSLTPSGSPLRESLSHLVEPA